jgi:hypothetical protein
MDLDLHHTFPGEFEFVEDLADGREHGPRFGRDIAEHFETGGKVGRDQPGQKSILVIQYDLAEGRPRLRDGLRLDSG